MPFIKTGTLSTALGLGVYIRVRVGYKPGLSVSVMCRYLQCDVHHEAVCERHDRTSRLLLGFPGWEVDEPRSRTAVRSYRDETQ